MSTSSNKAQWFAIIFLALVSIILGVGLGVASQALLPVKTFTGSLPLESAKKPVPLPKVYWLKAYTTRTIGNVRLREKEILDGQATTLTDREIGNWMGRVYAGQEVTEDIDAKLGTPFIRIGGQGRDDAKEPVLTVTMPFKLKVATLPVSEVPLQFTARPSYNGGETTWEISNVHIGHANVPASMEQRVIEQAIAAVVEAKPEAKKMWEQLGKYRRVTIRDNKLLLESPAK